MATGLRAAALALAFVAGAAAEVGAQPSSTVIEWKVSRLVFGYYETCDGGRGFVRAQGDHLAYFDQGMMYPNWLIRLQPDGSTHSTIGEYIYVHRRLRVTVAAGTGPRMITTMNEVSLCTFKYVPD